MSSIQTEIERRRTFAIISHPDAGKTTITEKFLWYGGVVREAGHVKAKSNKKFAMSDWMKIEQQRGISVTSSAISFPFRDCHINLLDTPGHQDFCEDTFRALTAVDSALVMIDSTKGVEAQTIKLMNVCRMRNTPIIIFMNKLDLDGRDAIELMDEVEKVLGIKPVPMSLPIGNGKLFQGVYSLIDNTVHFFNRDEAKQSIAKVSGLDDPKLDEWFEAKYLAELRERAELVQGAMESFDRDRYLKGEIGPLYFGSAIRNFGVKQLLDSIVEIAPSPVARLADERLVQATEPNFTGFVFKIQANTDPKHRDRIAYIRICSGKFERGNKALHCKTGKPVRLAAPTQFMANNKTVIDVAYAGDIFGVHDPGTFAIGDTLSESESLRFQGIPDFAPEHFVKVWLTDPMKSKQMTQGLRQLSEEGATQLFYPLSSPAPILGVVGELQFDVIKFRLEEEYLAKCRFEPVNVAVVRWITGTAKEIEKFKEEHSQDVARDKRDGLAYLCPNAFRLATVQKNYPNLQFLEVSERYGAN